MVAVGSAYLLVTMLPAVDPRWREIDRRPQARLDPAGGPASDPVSA
jgi:hypothetical protein